MVQKRRVHILVWMNLRLFFHLVFQVFKQGNLVDYLEGANSKNLQTVYAVLLVSSNCVPSFMHIVHVVLRHCQEGLPKGLRRDETEDFRPCAGVANKHRIREARAGKYVVEGAADPPILCDLE
ncbi:hypothetical protein BJ741DRAFT_276124 [Chytriomyces cf. hyalinus JEL632]|nr:hypothetical protein BJ741DRAFT_276124 [Chytriomyces cf. hyalinus JEL632]